LSCSRDVSVEVGKYWQSEGDFEHVTKDHLFKDAFFYYHFLIKESFEKKKNIASSPMIHSHLRSARRPNQPIHGTTDLIPSPPGLKNLADRKSFISAVTFSTVTSTNSFSIPKNSSKPDTNSDPSSLLTGWTDLVSDLNETIDGICVESEDTRDSSYSSELSPYHSMENFSNHNFEDSPSMTLGNADDDQSNQFGKWTWGRDEEDESENNINVKTQIGTRRKVLSKSPGNVFSLRSEGDLDRNDFPDRKGSIVLKRLIVQKVQPLSETDIDLGCDSANNSQIDPQRSPMSPRQRIPQKRGCSTTPQPISGISPPRSENLPIQTTEMADLPRRDTPLSPISPVFQSPPPPRRNEYQHQRAEQRRALMVPMTGTEEEANFLSIPRPILNDDPPQNNNLANINGDYDDMDMQILHQKLSQLPPPLILSFPLSPPSSPPRSPDPVSMKIVMPTSMSPPTTLKTSLTSSMEEDVYAKEVNHIIESEMREEVDLFSRSVKLQTHCPHLLQVVYEFNVEFIL
jgi:hypothetical protein